MEEKFTKEDVRNAILLALGAFLLNVVGLGRLEFIRHTEADRALIAWGMAESGNYLVPKLIHSVILTKPPLFYWVLAVFIKIFGLANEFVLRLPSVVISALFLAVQYLFTRASGMSRQAAILAAVVLGTSVLFMQLAVKAEIDMLFGFLCAAGIGLSFFAVERRSFVLMMFSYLLITLSFLTKGPPGIAFLLAAHLACLPIFLRRKVLSIGRFVFLHFNGGLLFLAIILTWLFALSERVGFVSLKREFEIEIFQRVFEESTHPRPPFFYLASLFGGLAPWSVFFVIGGIYILRSVELRKQFWQNLYLAFSAIVLVIGISLLSFSDGKSSRYLFPVYAFAANLTAYAIFALNKTRVVNWLMIVGKFAAVMIVLACLTVFLLPRPSALDLADILPVATVFFVVAVILYHACARRLILNALGGLILLMFAVRLAQVQIYAPVQNSTRSVRPIADEVASILPAGVPLYNIELFERWITYYIKRNGRETFRLTPEAVSQPKHFENLVYIFLSEEEEGWRMEQFQNHGVSVEVLRKFSGAYGNFLLVRVPRDALKILGPHEYFPTIPSRPFYNEPDKNLAVVSQ